MYQTCYLLTVFLCFHCCIGFQFTRKSFDQLHPATAIFSSPHENVFSAPKMAAHILTCSATAITCFPGTILADVGSNDGITLTLISALRPTFDLLVNVLSFFFICRTILSWYPKTDITKFPYNAVVWPTEPLLRPVRELVPPAFGVDISAIIWIMLLSFSREILTGPQGIFTLIERKT